MKKIENKTMKHIINSVKKGGFGCVCKFVGHLGVIAAVVYFLTQFTLNLLEHRHPEA